jgi:hypothetical protein
MRGLVVIGVLLACATPRAQPPAPYADLLPALVDKIVSTVPPGNQVSVSPLTIAPNQDLARGVEREVARLLTSRGVRIAAPGTPAAASVIVGCGENLRERACVAEIRRGDSRDIVSSTSTRESRAVADGTGTNTGPVVAIEVMPLFAQRAPILDVLMVDDRLFVLDPSALTLYRRAQDDWQRVHARAIEPARIWPRDVRGRLRLTGTTLEAFLPGLVCRTSPELNNLSCAEQREPWPLPIDNAGLDALRNTFQTPEGTPFLSAAALDASAGARAVMVTAAHTLVLVDDARTSAGTIGNADDVASVAGACGGGAYIVTASGTAGASTDTLNLLRIEARKATAFATPIVLPGRVTALWSLPNAASATAVVRDPSIERHEAFQVHLSCSR